jgi:hypothetical protein
MNVENRLDDRLASLVTAATGGCFLFLGCILFLFGDLRGPGPLVFANSELVLVAGFVISLTLLFAYPKQVEWLRFSTLIFSAFAHAAIAGFLFIALEAGPAKAAMLVAEIGIAGLCAAAMFVRSTDMAPREVRKIDKLSESVLHARESRVAPAAIMRKVRMKLPLNVRIAASQVLHKFI